MVKYVDHIGIAVPELQRILEFYKETMGLELHEIEEVQEQKVRVAMFPVGDAKLEFLEPTASDSPIAKFLEKNNGRSGIHHIALNVDNLPAMLEQLKAKGVKLINETPLEGAGGKKVAFVHPSAAGILLELTQDGKDKH